MKRINKCLVKNYPGLDKELEDLGYKRKTPRQASGIIVYPETEEYEELPYEEIEFKEGWIDCFDEVDFFMSLASEEYYEPIIRSGIEKFSVVSPSWTDITYSEDEEVWKESSLRIPINTYSDDLSPAELRNLLKNDTMIL